MAHLVDINTALIRSGLEPSLENIKAFNGALTKASKALEAVLRTSFNASDNIDTFKVVNPENLVDPYGLIHLSLRSGFVVEPVVVKMSSCRSGLLDATPLDDDMYTLDTSNGVITLDLSSDVFVYQYPYPYRIANGSFLVSVDYTSGFNQVDYTVNTNVKASLYEAVPEWLKDSAIFLADSFVSSCSGAQKKSFDFYSEAYSLVYNHIRYFPSHINPIEV